LIIKPQRLNALLANIILEQLGVPLCDGERAVACVQDYCYEQACKVI